MGCWPAVTKSLVNYIVQLGRSLGNGLTHLKHCPDELIDTQTDL